MKYWLIVMFFTADGKYIDKVETPFENYAQCEINSGVLASGFVNTGTKIQSWCVSDDHYNGIKQDEGIPYDLGGEEE